MPANLTPAADAAPLVVAAVLGAQGVRGELKCHIVTDFPERFQAGVPLLVGEPPESRETLSARVEGSIVYLRFPGVDSREKAAALRGTDILVDARNAVPLPEGQFYWRDILGLRVLEPEGTELGTVVDIFETGANNVYVVRGPLGEVLLPDIPEVVREIDPGRGTMRVDLLPGMLPRPKPEPRGTGLPRKHPGRRA